MKKLQVDKIKFSYNYQFANNFINNLKKYEIDKDITVNHHIDVKLKEFIEEPIGEVLGNDKLLTIFNSDKRIVFSKVKDNIRVLMRHDYQYKNIEIILNKTKVKDLAMAEYVFSGIMFLELAEYLSYLPIHATAIKYKDDVLLISAPSGTGKSTHRKYWEDLFGKKIIVINDDKPLLSFLDNTIMVHGSPFSGEEQLNTNIKGKLKGIVFLQQGLTNKIRGLNKEEKIKELIRNTVTPKLDYLWDQVLSQIEKIIANIPIVELDATNSTDSVKAVYKYFYGKD